MQSSAASNNEVITAFASSNDEIDAVYVFGSSAAGRLTPESDVDVGILFARPPSISQFLQLQEDLSAALGIQADIVNLNTASPIIRMEVLKHGTLLVVRPQRKGRLYNFFVKTVNEYDDLKRVRRPIEQNILRGRIYA